MFDREFFGTTLGKHVGDKRSPATVLFLSASAVHGGNIEYRPCR